MKLNLYKCSTKDCEWYSLANEICKGAIPLYCGRGFLGNSLDVPPEKIEFFKEVEIDLSHFLDEETRKIEEENGVLKQKILNFETEEVNRMEYVNLWGRLYYK